MTEEKILASNKTRRIVGIVLVTLVTWLLQGCSEGKVDEPVSSTVAVTQTSNAALSADRLEKWSRSCAQCHVAGQAGAPRIGNEAEWAPRIEKGQATLLKHTIEGVNMMPALGYCMSCEKSDFIAMIEFMSSTRKEAMQ